MVIAGLFTYLQYHGFPENEFLETFLVYSFDSLIALQILKYIVGYVYTFQPKEYFSNSRIELTVVLVVLTHGLITLLGFNIVEWLGMEFNFQGDRIHLKQYTEQIYFLLFFFKF